MSMMKLFNSLSILAVVLSLLSCNVSKKSNSNNELPNTFQTIENNYDTVIIYSIQNFGGLKPPTTIMGFKNATWEIIKYQNRNNLLLEDSIKKYSCSSCDNVFNQIISLGLLELLNESELKYECKTYRDTIINGNKITEINDFSALEDIDIHTIEYKIGKLQKKITYRNPAIAIKICPYSTDRKKIIDIINLLNGL